MSTLSPQQQSVVAELNKPGKRLVKTSAVAGSGKTHLSIEAAKSLGLKGRYLAYNKAIAEEAAEKFKDTNIVCGTLHSLAYRAVVKQYGLNVGWFGYRDVRFDGSTKDAKTIVSLVDAFCSSGEVTPSEHFELDIYNNIDNELLEAAMDHIDWMADGKMVCTHAFYLKMFHGLLETKAITVPSTGLLILDEAGDVTPVSLAIFRAIDADKKLMVGDIAQNIYKFNNTINGFHALKGEGVSLPLTISYRVPSTIAAPIQEFMKFFVDEDFEFEGVDTTDTTVNSTMHITRYNSTLIGIMLDMQKKQQAFNTTRPAKILLELPLILANIDNGNVITNSKFKVLENLRRAYFTSPSLQSSYDNIYKYIASAMKDDEEIIRGLEAMLKYGKDAVKSLEAYAAKVSSPTNKVTLTTIHSSKGLESDKVIINDDINSAVGKAKVVYTEAMASVSSNDKLLDDANTEFLLYYVACTRAKKVLVGASELPDRPYK
jgi:superfamily I DNA/RNA helicase